MSLQAVMAAIAEQVQTELSPALEGVQVESRLVFNPTPPCIDVYPADPFVTLASFGEGYEALIVIRARVSTADQEGGQDLLLDLLDPAGDLSMLAALASDATFGGTVDDSAITEGSPSGYIVYTDAGGGGSLLGCEWRTRVILS